MHRRIGTTPAATVPFDGIGPARSMLRCAPMTHRPRRLERNGLSHGALRLIWVAMLVAGCGSDSQSPSGGNIVASADAADVDCGCTRGAFVPVCGVDGQTYDATCGRVCVPVDVACEGQCPCPVERDGAAAEASKGADASAQTDAGGQEDSSESQVCHSNRDCGAEEVCFVGLSSCGTGTGTCVKRLSTPCSLQVGGGCNCLDVSYGTCSPNTGGYCTGTYDLQACWHCILPE